MSTLKKNPQMFNLRSINKLEYSRWLNSRFYTFWSVTKSKKKKDQVFSICDLVDVTFEELEDNFDGVFEKIIEMENENNPDDKVTAWESAELKSYILHFMHDVDSDEEINHPIKYKIKKIINYFRRKK
jgi:hypothetical protein